VALTRTKHKTYILTQYTNESIFIKELMNKQNIQMDKSQLEETMYDQLPCPKCLVGTLIERRANQSKKTFVGCSNYPNCDYTVHTTSILSDKQPCSCGGYMIKRAGKYGAFYGCSNWPICKNKKKINNR
jgi:DNA helicase-4